VRSRPGAEKRSIRRFTYAAVKIGHGTRWSVEERFAPSGLDFLLAFLFFIPSTDYTCLVNDVRLLVHPKA
jgi:hypothetical protein